jgi:hypothetical protein
LAVQRSLCDESQKGTQARGTGKQLARKDSLELSEHFRITFPIHPGEIHGACMVIWNSLN